MDQIQRKMKRLRDENEIYSYASDRCKEVWELFIAAQKGERFQEERVIELLDQLRVVSKDVTNMQAEHNIHR